jgi:isocitrate dehydrogenase
MRDHFTLGQKDHVLKAEDGTFQNIKKHLFLKKQKYEMEMNYCKDFLHPCVLFYHTGDEVEFVNEEYLPL